MKSLNYRVMCDDCLMEAPRVGWKFICPKCKGEWQVDG